MSAGGDGHIALVHHDACRVASSTAPASHVPPASATPPPAARAALCSACPKGVKLFFCRATLVLPVLWTLFTMGAVVGFELLSGRILLGPLTLVDLHPGPPFTPYAKLPRVRVKPSNGHFLDEYGRTRIFHGLNVVYKQPPFLPRSDEWNPYTSFSARDARDLRRWGFNLVRLGVLWAGTFPASEAEADEAYLREVQRIVRLCEEEGIYVVVDMHSDVLSRRFCGNGIPDWTVDDALEACGQHAPRGDFPMPQAHPLRDGYFSPLANQSRWLARELAAAAGAKTALEVAVSNAPLYPNLSTCLQRDFFHYYQSNATGLTFDALYTNRAGLRDAFAAHWRLVAQTLQGAANVLMWEVMNEPWPGDIYKSHYWFPYTWWYDSAFPERELLTPLYKEIAAAIREVDHSHIIAYEGVMWDIWPQGWAGPVNPPELETLSWHAYCWWAPNVAPSLSFLCSAYHSLLFAVMRNNAKAQGGGQLLSEFGSLGNSTAELAELHRVVALADEHLVSRVYWQYKNYDDITSSGGYASLSLYPQGELQRNKLRTLATPYAQITAGDPQYMRFEAGVFALDYIPAEGSYSDYFAHDSNAPSTRTTAIHLNAPVHFPHGFRVVTTAPVDQLYIRLRGASLLEVTHANALGRRSGGCLVGCWIRVCVLPCEAHANCSAGQTTPQVVAEQVEWTVIWPWHPCRLQHPVFKEESVLCFSLLQMIMLIYLRLLQVRGAKQTLDPVLRHRRHLCMPPFAALRRIFFVLVSFSYTGSVMVITGIPILDDWWRWIVFLLLTLPLLLSSTVLTGYPAPAACAGFILLQGLWRLSYYPTLLFISDPVAATIVRTLVLPPLELTLLLVASNRARRNAKVQRFQEWAAFHQCWEAHWWARARPTGRRSDDPFWAEPTEGAPELHAISDEGSVIRVQVADAMRRWPMEISMGAAVAAIPGGVFGAGVGAAVGASLALAFAPALLPFWVLGGAWTGAILGIFGGLAIGVHMGRFAARHELPQHESRVGRSPSWRDIGDL